MPPQTTPTTEIKSNGVVDTQPPVNALDEGILKGVADLPGMAQKVVKGGADVLTGLSGLASDATKFVAGKAGEALFGKKPVAPATTVPQPTTAPAPTVASGVPFSGGFDPSHYGGHYNYNVEKPLEPLPNAPVAGKTPEQLAAEQAAEAARINKRQADIHDIVSGKFSEDPTVMERPGELRSDVATTPQEEAAATTPEEAKANAVSQNEANGLIPPEAPPEVKDGMQDDIDAATDLMNKANASMEQYNSQLVALLSSVTSGPEAQRLAQVNLLLAGTEDEVLEEMKKAGIPASQRLVAQIVNERDKALIRERQYLTDLIGIRDKQYDRLAQISTVLANNAARQFDNAFNIQGRMLDLRDKAQGREDKLAEKAEQAAQDRIDTAISSGGLAYMSDGELANLARGSSYSFAQLKAAQAATQDKTLLEKDRLALARSELAISEERLKQEKLKTEKDKSLTYKLGGPYDKVVTTMDQYSGDDGYVDTSVYAAWRSKAGDVDLFDATFGDRLNPQDQTAVGFKSNYDRLKKQGVTTAANTKVTFKDLPEATRLDFYDDLREGAELIDLWQNYPELSQDEITDLYNAHNEI